MLMNVSIVGNIIKDTYLEFPKHLFEAGDHGRVFLDTEFDEETLHYKNKESVLSGASIIDEVLKNFKINSLLSNKQALENHKYDCRYVLKTGNTVKYLTTNLCGKTDFLIPETKPDWIFIDRSARLGIDDLKRLEQYLELHQEVKLAIHTSQISCGFLHQVDDFMAKEVAKKLYAKAELVFVTGKNTELLLPLEASLNNQKVFLITPTAITNGEERIFLKRNKKVFQTHLTIYSIAAGTIFAALSSGWNVNRALRFAKINIENAKMSRTLSIDKLYNKLKTSLKQEDNLRLMAKALTADHRGILAIDESKKSIRRKLKKYGLPETRTVQEEYRKLLVTTPRINEFLNGIILAQETVVQKIANGQSVPEFLAAKGILPGVKVDLGLEKIHNQVNCLTCGLEDLDQRLSRYYNLGLRFTKWRAVFEVEKNSQIPEGVIQKNTRDLAVYAKKALEKKLVPIIEPEVLHGEQSIADFYKHTKQVLVALFEKLQELGIDLECCILKINMIYAQKNNPEETGRMTMRLISEAVPKNIGGVVFLSGGQSEEQATKNLQAIIRENQGKYRLSFSFGRAIQDPALKIWQGEPQKIDDAQSELIKQLQLNCLALNKKPR